MKILIIGGNSSVGSALKNASSSSNEVITAGRKNCDLSLDLNDPAETIVLPENLNAVVLAAAHFGGTGDKEIFDAENTNVLGTLKVCQAANKAKAKHFILVSTMFSCLKENSDNYNIYAISKRHSEEVASYYSALHSLPLTILRPTQIYGNGESFRKHQPFFYTIIDKAQKGEDVNLYGSNDPRRNYIHIEDLTSIIVKVIQQKTEGIYSCGNTSDVTYMQIANAAFKAFNSKGKVNFLKDKPNIPDNIFEKDNSLYEKIGFYPQISIEDGINRLSNERLLIK